MARRRSGHLSLTVLVVLCPENDPCFDLTSALSALTSPIFIVY